MGKTSGRGSGSGDKHGGGIGHEDFLLWKEFTHDIEPLEEPDWESLERMAQEAVQQKPQTAKTMIIPLEGKPVLTGDSRAPVLAHAPPQLDGRTDARLRRGQMPIEGRLDLHGNTQDEAHRRLNDFILRAQAQGKRCVLVITGKGSSRSATASDDVVTGVLRRNLPAWLSMAPLRGLVLKSYPAVQRDGGSGAWYLYLKRNRDY